MFGPSFQIERRSDEMSHEAARFWSLVFGVGGAIAICALMALAGIACKVLLAVIVSILARDEKKKNPPVVKGNPRPKHMK